MSDENGKQTETTAVVGMDDIELGETQPSSLLREEAEKEEEDTEVKEDDSVKSPRHTPSVPTEKHITALAHIGPWTVASGDSTGKILLWKIARDGSVFLEGDRVKILKPGSNQGKLGTVQPSYFMYQWRGSGAEVPVCVDEKGKENPDWERVYDKTNARAYHHLELEHLTEGPEVVDRQSSNDLVDRSRSSSVQAHNEAAAARQSKTGALEIWPAGNYLPEQTGAVAALCVPPLEYQADKDGAPQLESKKGMFGSEFLVCGFDHSGRIIVFRRNAENKSKWEKHWDSAQNSGKIRNLGPISSLCAFSPLYNHDSVSQDQRAKSILVTSHVSDMTLEAGKNRRRQKTAGLDNNEDSYFVAMAYGLLKSLAWKLPEGAGLKSSDDQEMKICVIRGVKKFTFKMKRSEKVRKVKQKVSDKWKELPLSSSELIERTNGKYYKPLDDDWTIKDCALSEKLVKERGVDIPYAELEVLFKRRNDILGDTPWSRTLGETLTSSDTRRESIVCIEQLDRRSLSSSAHRRGSEPEKLHDNNHDQRWTPLLRYRSDLDAKVDSLLCRIEEKSADTPLFKESLRRIRQEKGNGEKTSWAREMAREKQNMTDGNLDEWANESKWPIQLKELADTQCPIDELEKALDRLKKRGFKRSRKKTKKYELFVFKTEVWVHSGVPFGREVLQEQEIKSFPLVQMNVKANMQATLHGKNDLALPIAALPGCRLASVYARKFDRSSNDIFIWKVQDFLEQKIKEEEKEEEEKIKKEVPGHHGQEVQEEQDADRYFLPGLEHEYPPGRSEDFQNFAATLAPLQCGRRLAVGYRSSGLIKIFDCGIQSETYTVGERVTPVASGGGEMEVRTGEVVEANWGKVVNVRFVNQDQTTTKKYFSYNIRHTHEELRKKASAPILLEGHKYPVVLLCALKNRLLSSSSDGKLFIWDSRKEIQGRSPFVLPGKPHQNGPIMTPEYSDSRVKVLLSHARAVRRENGESGSIKEEHGTIEMMQGASFTIKLDGTGNERQSKKPHHLKSPSIRALCSIGHKFAAGKASNRLHIYDEFFHGFYIFDPLNRGVEGPEMEAILREFLDDKQYGGTRRLNLLLLEVLNIVISSIKNVNHPRVASKSNIFNYLAQYMTALQVVVATESDAQRKREIMNQIADFVRVMKADTTFITWVAEEHIKEACVARLASTNIFKAILTAKFRSGTWLPFYTEFLLFLVLLFAFTILTARTLFGRKLLEEWGIEEKESRLVSKTASFTVVAVLTVLFTLREAVQIIALRSMEVMEVKQRKQYEEQSYVVAAIERKQKMPGRGGGERRFFREFLSQELRTWLLETGLWCLTQFARAVAIMMFLVIYIFGLFLFFATAMAARCANSKANFGADAERTTAAPDDDNDDNSDDDGSGSSSSGGGGSGNENDTSEISSRGSRTWIMSQNEYYFNLFPKIDWTVAKAKLERNVDDMMQHDVLTCFGLAKAWRWDAWNWVDLTAIILLWSVLYHPYSRRYDDRDYEELDRDASFHRYNNICMLATIALYSKIIGYLKQCDESFSGFVRMIFTIVRDLKEFIVVLFVIFALATHVFVLRAHARGSYGEDDFRGAFESLPRTAFTLFRLGLIGDFSFGEESEFKKMDIVLLSLFTVAMTVVMLNVLIAIVSDSYEKSMSIAKPMFWSSRFFLINEVDHTFTVMRLKHFFAVLTHEFSWDVDHDIDRIVESSFGVNRKVHFIEDEATVERLRLAVEIQGVKKLVQKVKDHQKRTESKLSDHIKKVQKTLKESTEMKSSEENAT